MTIFLPAREPQAASIKKAEVGILFIHGIGEQSQGQTLIDFAEPLYDWLRRWFNGADAYWKKIDADRSEGDPLDGYCPDQLYRQYSNGKVLLKDVSLEASSISGPAHATLEIDWNNLAVDEPQSCTWLLAESRWASCFPVPSFAKVASWSIKNIPWIFMSFVGRRIRRAVCASKITDQASSPIFHRLKFGVRILLLFVLALFIGPAALVVDLFLFLLLLLNTIPLPPLRAYLSWIQTNLSAVVGDSYSFTESDLSREAVIAHVSEDLRWLNKRCEKLVIVAHSQGAAVAYYVLERRQPKKLSTLVTFGSGIIKLFQISGKTHNDSLSQSTLGQSFLSQYGLGRGHDRDHRIAAPFAFFLFMSVCMIYQGFYLLYFLPSNGIADIWAEWSSLLAGLIMLAICVLISSRKENLQSLIEWTERLEKNCKDFRWFDFYASSDPVPNGPLFIEKEKKPSVLESVEVRNLCSSFGDHTSYRWNFDEFISGVVLAVTENIQSLKGITQLTPFDEKLLRTSAVRRRERIRLWKQHRIMLLSVLTLLLNRNVLRVIGEHVSSLFSSASEQVVLIVEGENQLPGNEWAVSDTLIGALCVVLGYIAASKLLNLLWEASEQLEFQDFFDRFQQRKSTLSPAMWSFASVIAAAVPVLVLYCYIPTGFYTFEEWVTNLSCYWPDAFICLTDHSIDLHNGSFAYSTFWILFQLLSLGMIFRSIRFVKQKHHI